jgi:hypothetical protein
MKKGGGISGSVSAQADREGGSGFSGATWRREGGGPGLGCARSGSHRGRPDNGGCGQLPTTWNRGWGREGGGGVAGVWAGSAVRGPAIGRERVTDGADNSAGGLDEFKPNQINLNEFEIKSNPMKLHLIKTGPSRGRKIPSKIWVERD